MEEAKLVQNLVQSVATKQQANKRKRDPDMYLDAVLECTVRRLNRERMEREETARKKRRTQEKEEKKRSEQLYINNNSSPLSVDCLIMNEVATTLDSIHDCDQMDRHLDEELTGDLKELLDELAREFPRDFWLNDTNNNNNNNCNSPSSPTAVNNCEVEESNDEMWLTNIIEVLCSS